MSLDGFIRLFQSLLTMADPDNELSIEYAETILRMVFALARQSSKVDSVTMRCMDNGIHSFRSIFRHREEFIGKPGAFKTNNAKRQRLKDLLYPSC